MAKTLTLSVHELVDFLLRSGDINSFIYSSTAMQEGVRLHSIHQRAQNSSYLPEYFLKHTFAIDDYLVTLEGRADGVILGTIPTVQEIKSSVIDIDLFKEQVISNPNKEAIICNNQRITFNDLDCMSDKFAAFSSNVGYRSSPPKI